MLPGQVMVVDDDDDGRECLERILVSRGHSVTSYADGESALGAIARGYSPPVAILDVMMPGTSGLEVLDRLKAMSPSTVVVMLSAVSQPDTIVQASRLGATRYVAKPVAPDAFADVVMEAAEAHAAAQEVQTLEDRVGRMQAAGEIITADPAMIRLQETARRVAGTDISVLITGESGVGKEIVARFLHDHSGRRSRPFVKVNCAALPHDLLESEMFGHQKGAFTGAIADRPGKFEQADRGTIFLDEIGDMSPLLQAKLLHVLQDGEICPLGGKTKKVDARVIAATNRPLEEAVRRKEFREDLYYRLNVVRLTVPPLRGRPVDLPLLIQHFLKRYTDQYQRSYRALPAELLAAFRKHDWPGNVRELENAIRRYVVLQNLDGALGELGQIVRHEAVLQGMANAAPAPARSLTDVGSEAAESAEREMILRTLEAQSWNKKRTARDLNICYKTLLNKIKRWDIGKRTGAPAPPRLDSR
jgi:two-component system response regulator AtoC